MKRTERQLLLFAGALFALVLIVRVIPLLYDYYRQGREEIALLEERADRYQQLIIDTELWMERETLKAAEITDLQSWVFEGNNPNLIGSGVQRVLRQTMDQAGLRVTETSVARYSYIGNWLMVSQDMSFSLEQHQILPFLNILRETRPRLHIAAMTINRNRRSYNGSITVVGFGRAE